MLWLWLYANVQERQDGASEPHRGHIHGLIGKQAIQVQSPRERQREKQKETNVIHAQG